MNLKKLRIAFGLLMILCLSGSIFSVKGLGNTTISLEPKTLELPLLDTQQGSIFTLELKASTIQGLKELHLNFEFDSGFVEYLGGGIDSSFYLITEGWTGSELDGRLTNTFSGSGVMFRYWFKALKTGTTQINLIDVSLLNEAGSTIPVTTSGCTVKIISLADYLGGEFAALSNNYRNLSKLFNDTIIATERLTMLYNSTKNDYDNLNTLYTELQTKYNSLNSNYNQQLTNFNTLLLSNEKLKSDLANQTNIIYILLVTTVIFLISTIYLIMKKREK